MSMSVSVLLTMRQVCRSRLMSDTLSQRLAPQHGTWHMLAWDLAQLGWSRSHQPTASHWLCGTSPLGHVMAVRVNLRYLKYRLDHPSLRVSH